MRSLARVVLISAHAAGIGPDSDSARLRAALPSLGETPGEYVELDVSVTADGEYVCRHAQQVAIDGRPQLLAETTLGELRRVDPDVVLLDEAIEALRGSRRAHLDVKLDRVRPPVPPSAYVRLAKHAVTLLDPADLLLTTGGAGVAAIRAWSRGSCPMLLVGIAISPSWIELARLAAWSLTRYGDPVGRRVRACDANLVVPHYLVARFGVAHWAAGIGLPTLVWTVDGERELRRWLHAPGVFAVCTDRPAEAVRMRQGA